METQQAVAKFEHLPLPARQQSPIEPVPAVACVQMDGGRYQERERIAEPEAAARNVPAKQCEAPAEADSAGHWREYKAGVLTTMASEVHAADPCPELPATFADPEKMRELPEKSKVLRPSAAAKFWSRRLERLIQSASYHQAA